jgi:ATP-dependent DNA helicase RecQ
VVLDRRLDQIPTYGKLGELGLDRVKDLLGVLADSGLVERHGIAGGRPGAFVLALSPEGRAVAKGEHRPQLELPTAEALPARHRGRGRKGPVRGDAPAGTKSPPDDAASGAIDPELFARLKAWRTAEARRRGVPPYVVFHDRTLAALAAAAPQDASAMLLVSGIGPAKLEAYGAELLRLMARTLPP